MPVRSGDVAVWINHKDEPEVVVVGTISPSGKSMNVLRQDGTPRIAESKRMLTIRQAANRGILPAEGPHRLSYGTRAPNTT